MDSIKFAFKLFGPRLFRCKARWFGRGETFPGKTKPEIGHLISPSIAYGLIVVDFSHDVLLRIWEDCLWPNTEVVLAKTSDLDLIICVKPKRTWPYGYVVYMPYSILSDPFLRDSINKKNVLENTGAKEHLAEAMEDIRLQQKMGGSK